jgi:hypothetical protein
MADYPSHVTRELAFDAIIQKGDTGAKVCRVQEWLSIGGFATTNDGGFGNATEKCVKTFQESKGIAATGKVNQQTWSALAAMGLRYASVRDRWRARISFVFRSSRMLKNSTIVIARRFLSRFSGLRKTEPKQSSDF